MLLNKLLSPPSFTGSQAVILNMQHDRSSEATTVAAADCCFILQPVLRRFPLSVTPLQPTLSAANHWPRLALLIFRLHSLKHQLKWFLLNPATLHLGPFLRFPLVAARSNASFYFYFYFSRVWQKCLLKGLFNSNGFLYGANLHLHSLTRSWIILWPQNQQLAAL